MFSETIQITVNYPLSINRLENPILYDQIIRNLNYLILIQYLEGKKTNSFTVRNL